MSLRAHSPGTAPTTVPEAERVGGQVCDAIPDMARRLLRRRRTGETGLHRHLESHWRYGGLGTGRLSAKVINIRNIAYMALSNMALIKDVG